MDRFKGKYRIPSARLKEWDYASPGFYFVTICTAHHQSFFGEISSGEVQLSALGKIAHSFWSQIPSHFPNIELDEFIIMPNHVHGIIVINDIEKAQVETQRVNGIVETQHAASLPQYKPAPGSLSTIVRAYKSAVKRWAGQNGHSDFAWQSRFYEHVIRDEDSLRKIRKYIRGNAELWELDDYHPAKRIYQQ